MFDRFKKLRFEHFAKHLPLIIETSGGLLLGGAFFIQGKRLVKILE